MLTDPDLDSSPIELSAQELEEISGGIDFYLSGSIFEQQLSFSRPRRRSRHSQGSLRTFSSAFQFGGSGFTSVEDILAVLRGLNALFGRRG
jgi:hypothetical protein